MSNVFAFTGALGRNAELKQVGSGNVLSFAVANSVGFGDKKTTIWVDCNLWGARGEKIAAYLVKGQSVFVSGELTTREYPAKDGSGTKTALALNVNVVDLIGKKDTQQPAPVQQSQPYQTPHQQYQQAVAQHNTQPQYAPQQSEYSDDIPF